jgi:hypothetical protein
MTQKELHNQRLIKEANEGKHPLSLHAVIFKRVRYGFWRVGNWDPYYSLRFVHQ